jgi:hypothetical protein
MIAPLSHTTPLEPCVADASTDPDHILDNRQFDPYSLTRETLAAEVKSSTQSQFVLDTSVPDLN